MQNIFAVLAFTFGAVLEILVLMRGKWKKEDRLLFMILTVMSVYMFVKDYPSGLLDEGHMLITVLVIMFFAVALFAQRMWIVIDEAVLLLWQLVFAYTYFQIFGANTVLNYLVIALTLIVFYINLTPKKLPSFFKVIFYLWYLFILVFFAILRFPYLKDIFLTNSEIDLKSIPLFSIFIMGVLTVYVFLGLCSVAGFLPSRSSGFADVPDHIKSLLSKFDNAQTNFKLALSLTFAAGGLFMLNYYYSFMNPALLTSLVVVFGLQILGFLRHRQSQQKTL